MVKSRTKGSPALTSELGRRRPRLTLDLWLGASRSGNGAPAV